MSVAAAEKLGSAGTWRIDERLAAQAADAAEGACNYLLNRQTSTGYWVGELEGDTTLAADYILLQLWLHQPDEDGSWNPPTRPQVERASRRILAAQLEDGGWSLYPGGPSNVSASVKAYCGLKLSGLSERDERMCRAAARILDLGGIEAANSYTKLYLSYFGLYPKGKVPSVPPEIFLLPPQHRFSVFAMSSWSRAMLAPLSILDATKARRRVPCGISVREIRTGRETTQPERSTWQRFFLMVDRGIKMLESTGVGRDRQKAIDAASEWMLARLERSEGLGAIFPAMVNSVMALTQIGYRADDPLLTREIEHFEELILDDAGGFRVQPCRSPVWDTALTTYAIAAVRPNPDEMTRWALSRAADWLLSKQVRHRGDWSVRRPNLEPGGWYFEHKNEHYPDTDDTAKVLLALERAKGTDPDRQKQAEGRAVEWLAAMQSSDGGWAAFDVDNSASVLTQVPFADHNAMLDPTCADITGRVIEALSRRARDRHRDGIRRGVEYLRRTQEVDGCWYGRWGVNYIYGTCFALRGLRAAGVYAWDEAVLQAGEWIRSVQNPDGGWGESPSSYEDPRNRATGPSTSSQTAWALLGLFASDDFESASVREGIRYLLDKQTSKGSWTEEASTGCGFPRVFYLRYHMYPQYFPLMALGEFIHRRADPNA